MKKKEGARPSLVSSVSLLRPCDLSVLLGFKVKRPTMTLTYQNDIIVCIILYANHSYPWIDQLRNIARSFQEAVSPFSFLVCFFICTDWWTFVLFFMGVPWQMMNHFPPMHGGKSLQLLRSWDCSVSPKIYLNIVLYQCKSTVQSIMKTSVQANCQASIPKFF